MNQDPYLNFKSVLFARLEHNGFTTGKDISTKSINNECSTQILLTGNQYFIAINFQMTFPESEKILTKKLQGIGNKEKFSSGNVHFPIFSVDVLKAASNEFNFSLNEVPDWINLHKAIPDIVTHMFGISTSMVSADCTEYEAWWPEHFSEAQASILLISLSRQNCRWAKQPFSHYVEKFGPEHTFGGYLPLLRDIDLASLSHP